MKREKLIKIEDKRHKKHTKEKKAAQASRAAFFSFVCESFVSDRKGCISKTNDVF